MHRILCQNFWPDLTILMDSEVDHSVKRARRRNAAAVNSTVPDENRFEGESYAFFTRVRDAYLAIAKREPQRVAMVDARRPPEVVHPEIVVLVRERLLRDRQPSLTQSQARSVL